MFPRKHVCQVLNSQSIHVDPWFLKKVSAARFPYRVSKQWLKYAWPNWPAHTTKITNIGLNQVQHGTTPSLVDVASVTIVHPVAIEGIDTARKERAYWFVQDQRRPRCKFFFLLLSMVDCSPLPQCGGQDSAMLRMILDVRSCLSCCWEYWE